MTTRRTGWIVGALAVALVLSMIAPGAVIVLAVPVAVVGSILTRRRPTGHEDRDVAERLVAAAATLTSERTSSDGEQVDWGAAVRAELATITVPRERRRFAVGAALTTLVAVAVVDGVEAAHWYHVAPDVSVLDGDHVDVDSTRAAVLDVVHPIILLVHLVFWSPWPVLGAWAGREHRGPPPADA